MKEYTLGFKLAMVKKMMGPPSRSPDSLAKEVGVSKSALWKWRHTLAKTLNMTNNNNGKSQKQWSASEKLEVLLKAATLSQEELGGYLREQGIYETQLTKWKEEAIQGLSGGVHEPELRNEINGERKKVKELEREIHRKERALAETAALLVLKKKVHEIWGDEDDDTRRKNGSSSSRY